ncbi:MAG TPA: hypothetical protein VJU81_18870 [Methylomirabilota bacterium]|nr:hypothetical protein [Methylomirabilota bacterium]
MSSTRRRVFFILVFALASLMAFVELTWGVVASRRLEPAVTRSGDPLEAPEMPVPEIQVPEIQVMDAALARGDISTAVRARHSAHQRATTARSWQGMLAVGDATRRLEEATGYRAVALSEARRAYLAALYRARQQGSLEGALGAARAFAALGDRDMVEGSLAIAADLAARRGDPQASDQVREMAVRLAFAEASDARR